MTKKALGGKYNFRIVAQEDDLLFIEVSIGDKILEFGGDFIRKDDTLTINNFDIDGKMTNQLGIKGVKDIVVDYGRQVGVKKIIIEGAPRTTGANPGKITKLVFDV